MHPIEAAKQRQYKWWMDVFLPGKVRPGNRYERYRLGILAISMLAFFASTLVFAIQGLSLPIASQGKLSACLITLVPVVVLLHVRWTGRYQQSALYFALLATPFAVIHMLSLKTIYIGFFHWVPLIIIFVSFLAGRRQGLLIAAVLLSQTLLVLHWNGAYGHSLGAYRQFDELFFHLLENQTLSMLAIAVVMFTFALYNDRMEAELESQHVLRAQTAHKSMIGEMLGNLAHEVNNPLAIVHTAVLHYQRLLQTKRLEKYMQHGLTERIKDALDRMRSVVEDLNSSADWSDLEIPRSYASLQPDQDRPPQFGSSRLMNSIEGTRSDERRSMHWFYQLMRMIVDGLDWTLPRVTRTWSTSQRFRARATALICSIGMMAMAANLLQLLIERADEPVLVTGYLYFGIGILGMLVLKLVPRPQMIGVGYIILLFAATVGLSSTSGRSVLQPALHWFPLHIASLFLVARPRTALIVSILLLVGNAILMIHLRSFGLQLSFAQTFPQYVLRLQSTLISVNITMVVLSAAFISLMNSTYSQLVAEKDWYLLSARMREINELADSAAILIGEPLKHLDQLLRELKSDGQNPDILQRMQAAVDRINRVSQSFALLSRPKINEDIQTIHASVWMEQIQNICFRRAAEAGWNLSISVEPADGLIKGPLGRLTMLVITSLKEAFGHRAPQKSAPLRLQVRIDEAFTHLRIQFMASPRSDAPPDQLEEAMRLSLLQELLESLHASLERRLDQNDIILELRWRHANFRENLLP